MSNETRRRGAALPTQEAGPATGTPPLRAICWGTRGSIPSPGPATARYGGNTSCLEIIAHGERRLIFDAGTGIRVLGNRLLAEASPVQANLFLTHFHWDHIQGIPFFGPLYQPETVLRIHGRTQDDADLSTLFAGQMGAIYFPVPYEALKATLEFEPLGDAPWQADGVEVAAFLVRHPGLTWAYRVRAQGASIVYIPDNELVGARYPVGPKWYNELVTFIGDADLLLHDAMFTDDEYPAREGWGHSTYRQTMKLAVDAGAKRLLFFHHAPERSDLELDAILVEMARESAAHSADVELGIAAEGEEIEVLGSPS